MWPFGANRDCVSARKWGLNRPKSLSGISGLTVCQRRIAGASAKVRMLEPKLAIRDWFAMVSRSLFPDCSANHPSQNSISIFAVGLPRGFRRLSVLPQNRDCILTRKRLLNRGKSLSANSGLTVCEKCIGGPSRTDALLRIICARFQSAATMRRWVCQSDGNGFWPSHLAVKPIG